MYKRTEAVVTQNTYPLTDVQTGSSSHYVDFDASWHQLSCVTGESSEEKRNH